MIPDKVIYTDGHDVIVTGNTLHVKSTIYQLKGVTKHGFVTLQPDRMAGILIFALGALFMGIGLFELITPHSFPDIYAMNTYISANTIVDIVGAVLIVTALIVTVVTREKYAVRISTALGEKDVIVSRKKDYIQKIIEAIDEAVATGTVYA